MRARIYKIINDINGKEYVGQTYKTIEERLEKHIKDSSSGKKKYMPILMAIQKYGKKHFNIVLLEELSENLGQEDVDKKEVEWGLKLNTLSPNGYNLKLGNARGILSEETKKKIGDIHRGKVVSEETRNKISKANLGKKLPQQVKDKISKNSAKFWLGKKRSEEDKLKMSKPKTFTGQISPLSKPVTAYCNRKKYEFKSVAEAVRCPIFDKKVTDSNIIKCCKGKLKSVGKIEKIPVKWEYKNRDILK